MIDFGILWRVIGLNGLEPIQAGSEFEMLESI